MEDINTTVLTIGENNLVLQDGGLRANKVSSFQSTPDNDHFPSEKLVKDSLDLKMDGSLKGANNGVAELNSSGKVPNSQLPTIPDVSTKYDTADTAGTAIDDADYIPFYDTSATARKKSLWSNIKSKLKTYFDGIYLTSHQDISGKADKVSRPTNGNFASLDANGNLQDSGHKHSDYLTSHQDISGKADKVSRPTNGNFASLDSNGNIADSGHKHSDYLTSHQDISGKADKVSRPTNGNFASLDSNGNIADSGHKHSDYLTSHQDISGKADKVIPDADGNVAFLNSNGNLEDLGVGMLDLFAALNNMHSHTNKSVLDMVPSSLGTAGKALCVNDNGNGLEFKTISGGGGLSNYDLTFSTLSNNTTNITFEANQQCYKRMTMTAGATLNFSVLNKGCNYLRIYNSSASDITLAIGTITFNNTAVTTKIVPDDAITVKAGKYVEIGVAADAAEADITVSGILKSL